MTISTIEVRTSQQGLVTVTVCDDNNKLHDGLEGCGMSLQEALEDLAYNLDEIAETV